LLFAVSRSISSLKAATSAVNILDNNHVANKLYKPIFGAANWWVPRVFGARGGFLIRVYGRADRVQIC